MRKLVVRITLVTASLGLASMVATPRADACGLAIAREVDARAVSITKAERALQQGQNTAAAVNVAQVFPSIRSAQIGADMLATRAMRVMALAVARADGAVTMGTDWRGATAAQRTANLEWAATTMRAVSTARAGDPTAQADLGETLAKIPRFQAEAKTILDGLAQKDLIGSAQAYAALARLRAAGGDKPGRDAAVAKCQAMTQVASVCAVPNS